MKEGRRKIFFKQSVSISKFRFWTGLTVSLFLSFTSYLVFTSIRDFYRILSLDENFNYLTFTKEELFFYNLFFAFLGLIIGLHFFIKINFYSPKVFKLINNEFKKRRLINNQNTLLWYFMSVFSKLSFIYGGFIMTSFGLEKNYNLNLFNYINFYQDYNYLFILIILVLFFQALMTSLFSFKKKLIVFIVIVLLALIFAQYTVIDLETFIMKLKNE